MPKLKGVSNTHKFDGKTLYWVNNYYFKDDANRRAKIIRNLGHQARVVPLPKYLKLARHAVYASRLYLPGFRKP